ncbi:MAG: O-antigen ligase family protein, partial [Sinomonas sp.]|nr:O-antigen ligase family protein [Sinomonas sp.]
DRKRGLIARWCPVVVIATASILSVSRSALIAVVIAVAVLAASWTARQKLIAAGFAVALVGVVYFAVPGMAGTIVGMFTGAPDDSSIASRVNGYDVAFGMVARLPYFGRGFGTLLPSYVYLDNQYLGIVVELGLFGLVAVLSLFVTAIVSAWRSRKLVAYRLASQLGAAIAAAVAAGATSFTFFDALSFPLSSAFMFLLLGLAGAYARLAHTEPAELMLRDAIAATR